MHSGSALQNGREVAVLIVDDSIVFRRFLRDMFEGSRVAVICGEAQNGIEALDVMLRVDPDVIMMDMEMPLMDGMTALQHLMIHRPLPTIMFSSLTSEGTVRAFDALKNGAVDFMCKDFIFQENDPKRQRDNILKKVIRASRMTVEHIEPVVETGVVLHNRPPSTKHVLFCEECGSRNLIDPHSVDVTSAVCSQCGDALVIHNIRDVQDYHEYIQYVTILGGGEGAFRNLLNIIPSLNSELVGSVIAVIYGNERQVDTFTEYLDAVCAARVLRIQEGMRLERGCCYIAAASDYICLRPQGIEYTLKKVKNLDREVGSLDLLMASVSSTFKERTAGVLLSGEDMDGLRGVSTILKNMGIAYALEPTDCLCRDLVKKAMETTGIEPVSGELELARKINELHNTRDES